MKKVFLFVLIALSIKGALAQTVTDIDGHVYNTVTIGTQVWMKENLDVATYRNGDAIPQVTDSVQWANLTTGAWCYYNNNADTGAIYGKLYNWYAVNDPRGLAPAGWHVPGDAEWTTLTDFLGGYSVAGGKMKEIGTIHWQAPNAEATNSSGFAGLPGGVRDEDGAFNYIGNYGFWWSSTESNTTGAWNHLLYYYSGNMYRSKYYKRLGLSVRCLNYQLPYTTPTNAIKLNGSQATTRDPIQLGTGTYTYKHNDIKIPCINASLNFTRFYNSLNGNVTGPLGNGRSHTYHYNLVNKQDTAWDIHYPDGHVSTFIPMNYGGQSFPVFSGTTDSLQKNNNNSYSLFTKEKQQYHFDATGKLDSIIDLNNNIAKLYYTGNSLDSIVAPGGRALAITYTGNNITSVKDPLNRICNYGYDADNNLITVTDANNGSASSTYDSAHHLLTATNPLGNTIVNNIYDSSGKVVTQKDAYNGVTSIVYNFPNAGDATVTNPDNSHTVAHHDNYIRKTNETDELGLTKAFAYDANSNENAFTNENNQSETRLFDNHGNLLADTLPGGKITGAAYNYFNAPVQLTDAKGNQKRFYYNSINNNLDSIRYPDNSLQVFAYNSKGQVMQSVDGNGNATAFTYSGAGDLLSTQTFAGIKQFAYDAAGRKVAETDENGHTTNYDYDNNDNIIKVTDALGRTMENT